MATKSEKLADDGLVRSMLTDESIQLMRDRIGFSNPTVRTGFTEEPWNTIATADAMRRFSYCIGDDNPLFCDPEYAKNTRWGETIAPPAFEKSMGIMGNAIIDDPEWDKETSKALRGVQLFHSGAEFFYWAPITEGVKLWRSRYVKQVDVKESEYAGRSAIVTNGLCMWDENDKVYVDGVDWFVHAERKKRTDDKSKYAKEEPAWYTDEEMKEIEDCYDNEYRRGSDTLYYEDVVVGSSLPKMVKGPFQITDLINMHMGTGWILYGCWPNRLAYEGRKKLRGFYTKDEFNAWDTLQRVHWDKDLADKVGVKMMYDIGAVRQFHVSNYLTNYAGDDAFIHRIKFEFRRFNYTGDVTWMTGEIVDKRIDPKLGPVIEVVLRGTNQRGNDNINATSTIMVASREHGPVKLPEPPAPTTHRRKTP